MLRSYLPYISGCILGLLLAFVISYAFSFEGTPQLILFGLMPGIGGGLFERMTQRR
jgi:hypothetical protein